MSDTSIKHTNGRLKQTFFLGIHKKGVFVCLFAVCIQKMELSFQPLNFLKANDKQLKWHATGSSRNSSILITSSEISVHTSYNRPAGEMRL